MLATGTSAKKPAVTTTPSPDTFAVSINPDSSEISTLDAPPSWSNTNTKKAETNIAMHAAMMIARFRRNDLVN
ncbi:hypothetical protein D3C84_1211040 [compost metagenome]